MRALLTLSCLAFAAAAAADSPGLLEAAPLRFAPQPQEPDADTPPVSLDEAPPPAPVFGREGSQWWTLGGAVADDFDGATDFNIHLGYTLFLVDGVEFTWENAAWYFDQDGDNALGFSSSIVFRWHFVSRQRWSLYADAGIGGLLATSDVPEDGTSVDLLPRLGVGMTHQLGEGPSRLQAGLRWHHISNARINSDESNPSRDAPLFYAAVVFPF